MPFNAVAVDNVDVGNGITRGDTRVAAPFFVGTVDAEERDGNDPGWRTIFGTSIPALLNAPMFLKVSNRGGGDIAGFGMVEEARGAVLEGGVVVRAVKIA